MWTNGGNLYVGYEGAGTLNIGNHVYVTNARGAVAGYASAGSIATGAGDGKRVRDLGMHRGRHPRQEWRQWDTACSKRRHCHRQWRRLPDCSQRFQFRHGDGQRRRLDVDHRQPTNVGSYGQGTLIVSNGAYVGTDNSSGNVRIGNTFGSSGSATVSGAGTLHAGGTLYVGSSYGSSGTLNVQTPAPSAPIPVATSATAVAAGSIRPP